MNPSWVAGSGLVWTMLIVTLLVAAVLVSMWLWHQAGLRERQDAVLARLRGDGRHGAPAIDDDDRRIDNPLLRVACHLVWRTGAEPEPAVVARWLLILAVLVPLALLVLGWRVGLVAVLVGLAIGWALLARQAARQRMRIIAQLPDYLEQVTRILSAGHTLEEALVAAARESPEPVRSLFLRVGRQVRLGAPVEAVLARMADLHRIGDLRVIALAASINRQYGGSLRTVFRSLVQAIRGRESAVRELRALTAETRFSAMVLAVIPVGLCLYILALNPDYYTAIWASGGGRGLLIGSGLLQLAGVLVIWRMLRGVESGEA